MGAARRGQELPGTASEHSSGSRRGRCCPALSGRGLLRSAAGPGTRDSSARRRAALPWPRAPRPGPASPPAPPALASATAQASLGQPRPFALRQLPPALSSPGQELGEGEPGRGPGRAETLSGPARAPLARAPGSRRKPVRLAGPLPPDAPPTPIR